MKNNRPVLVRACLCLLILAMVFVFSACDTPAAASVEPSPSAAATPAVTATPTATATVTPEPTPSATADSTISPLTGLKYSGKYQPVAVMVNNNKDCWPQTGLQAADVVYEIIVEGGITRFLAIYNDTLPEEVGSVRSARVSAVDMWQEWQCIYIHWGGEGDMRGKEHVVLNSFKTANIQIRVDGMDKNPYTFRAKKGYAPNNSRANIAKVVELYEKKKYTPPVHTTVFDPQADLSAWKPMSTLSVPYGYPVKYQWDAATASYLRFANKKPTVDAATDKQVSVKNLIVMFMPHRTLKDNEHHVVLDNVGTGKAIFCRDGKYIEGTWEKATKQSPAVYKDKKGNPIVFTPGNTWISVVKTGFKVTVK